MLYLTTLECEHGHETRYAHDGPAAPVDQEAPWPDVERCATCGTPYSDDLGAAATEVQGVEIPNAGLDA